jgi:LytS/YehU family sensor histidine kinase
MFGRLEFKFEPAEDEMTETLLNWPLPPLLGQPLVENAIKHGIDSSEDVTEESKSYLHWLRAGYGDTTVLIQDGDVVYFQANQKYTDVVTRDKTYVVSQSIKELENSSWCDCSG